MAGKGTYIYIYIYRRFSVLVIFGWYDGEEQKDLEVAEGKDVNQS